MMRTVGITQKWKRRLLLFALVLGICGCFPALKAWAGVTVKNAEWEGKGRVEVHFNERVAYCCVKVSVWDSAGKSLKTSIVDHDEDEIEFRVSGLKQGAKYKYRISGVRKKGCDRSSTVKGSFTVPKKMHGITMKETDHKRDKNLVNFEFLEEVEWKDPAVSIVYGDREYVLRIRKQTKKDIEVKVSKLKVGRKYRWTISGISRKGKGTFVTLSGTFTAS